MTKIAINGFGRIGRQAARILLSSYPDAQIVAVNDLTSVENLAYLLKYDSAQGQFEFDVTSDNSSIVIKKPDTEVRFEVFSQKDPALLPWKDLEIDVVLECTGFFLTQELAHKHIEAGAKRVILSAPAKDESVETLVLGVNNSLLDTSVQIISNASCTTNCIAPALYALNKNFNIHSVHAMTAHAYTASQNLQDAPSQKDFRGGRAAAINMIPSSTGAAKAVIKVLPELQGKLQFSALRVPVITGSMVYMVAHIGSLLGEGVDISALEIRDCFKQAAETYLKGIVMVTDDPLVSSDIVHQPYSTIVDCELINVLNNHAEIVLWYDNEWGYANRLVEAMLMIQAAE